MHFRVSELYELTPREFFNAQKGAFRLYDMAQRESWERCRFSTATLLNIQLPKGKKIKPSDLISFDWDKKSKPIELDDNALIQFLKNG